MQTSQHSYCPTPSPKQSLPLAFFFHRKQKPPDKKNTQRNDFTNDMWRIYWGKNTSVHVYISAPWEMRQTEESDERGSQSLLFEDACTGWVSCPLPQLFETPSFSSYCKPTKHTYKMSCDSFKALPVQLHPVKWRMGTKRKCQLSKEDPISAWSLTILWAMLQNLTSEELLYSICWEGSGPSESFTSSRTQFTCHFT